MQRSVIQLAGRTLVVSLPSKWCKERGIHKGSKVEVVPNGNVCSIQPEASKDSFDIEFSNLSDASYWYFIPAAYRSGSNLIRIKTSSNQSISRLRNIAKERHGLEITRQSTNFVELSEVSEPKYDELGNILNRTVHMIVQYAEDCANADGNELTRLFEYGDDTVNRLTDLCVRLIIKHPSLEKTEIIRKITFVKNCEEISDQIRESARIAKELPANKSNDLLRKQAKCVKMFSEAYFSLNPTKVDEILDLRKKIIAQHYDNALTNSVTALIKRAAETCTDIVTFNIAFGKQNNQ